MTGRPRQRDAHSVMIEQWLDQVLADPATKRMDFSVAWAVSLHFNRATRVAWAAVDEYAKRCHTDRRTVQRSLRRLESAGHLAAIKGGGRKVTTRYQPVLKNSGAGAAVSDAENSGAGAAVSAPKRAAGQPQKGGSPAPSPHENSGAGAAQPLKERIPLRTADFRAGARESESAPDLDSEFEEFFRQFPCKEAKDEARRAYRAVLKKGEVTPAELLHAAMLYAASVAHKEPGWTKMPSNWLRGGRWKEKPAPAPAPSQPMGFVDIAEAMARDAEDREHEP
jgi:hypothetical protein